MSDLMTQTEALAPIWKTRTLSGLATLSVGHSMRAVYGSPMIITGRGDRKFCNWLIGSIATLAESCRSTDKALAMLDRVLSHQCGNGKNGTQEYGPSDFLIQAASESEGLIERCFSTYGENAWKLVNHSEGITAIQYLPIEISARIFENSAALHHSPLGRIDLETIEALSPETGEFRLCEMATITTDGAVWSGLMRTAASLSPSPELLSH